MKKLFTLIVVLLTGITIVGFLQVNKNKVQTIFKREAAFFEKVTVQGKPDLGECYVYRGEMLGLRQAIAYFSLQGIDTNEQKAFYINAYNLAVLSELNEHFPIQSIEESPDFFNSQPFMVSKKQFNLRSLKRFIFDEFKDPRVYFALYISGISSPDITVSAFYREQVDKRLNKTTTSFINDMSRVKIKTRSKLVLLPEFMLWNKNDFGVKDDQEFLAYINQYRTKEKQIPVDYIVKFYPYSWKLTNN
jgi:hypothetical protein